MAKTSFISIPAGFETIYNKNIQSGDRFLYPHVKVKRLFTSRSRKKGLTQKSLIVQLAPVWASFSQEVKNAWTSAGANCDLTGFKLFVQDTSKRIANDISGYATPNELYQSMVGKIQIDPPAIGLKILQIHPQSYYISRKVSGTRSQYEPRLIQENLTLPLSIGISYKSNLISLQNLPYIVDSYSFSNYNENWLLSNSEGGKFQGQSFLNVSACFILSCKFYLFVNNNNRPSAGLRAKLYASDNSLNYGIPTGSVLATSDVIAGSALPTSAGAVEFTFSGSARYLMSANSKYIIVVENINDTGLVSICGDTSSPTHPGQNVSSFNGNSWAGNDEYVDIPFEVRGISSLEVIGDPVARFYVIVYSSYQGRTIENVCQIPFDLSHDWVRLTNTINSVIGVFRGYTAFIELSNVRGTLLFDNVEIIHTAQNWARDPFCNSIQTTFTKAFYQIPKHWAPFELENGAFYRSVYHDQD